ncbi:NAD(P)-binding protein [Eremomyces bilateralis CBS 781.70]|uniref:NAD(P)-binding protein n=1 Tax=Eremomyces bilateralis CBS 781.70 TaxID=1392243 RepID=A0A6G1GAJ6_9PEZI|nr:NAD(P)-binding protein [Eremomyces bilateralis CBS 781.70]KAF1815117.1 NAD(P)-binding protein [Eremomyces bilateralis CBS 781.70]
MRVVIAGTNSLALLIASYVKEMTSHQLIILSRFEQPQLKSHGFEVLLVDYDDDTSVKHALTGVHTVISTVTGPPQLQLIQAAVQTGVRRFAPAEFEGLPSNRRANDALDRDKTAALTWLQHYRRELESTTFACGVFYERFAPGGLAAYQIGLEFGLAGEGDYIMNMRDMRVQAPIYDPQGRTNVIICLTAMRDVAQFVVRALDMPSWPAQLTMYGEKMTVYQLTQLAAEVKGFPSASVQWHDINSLRSEIVMAEYEDDGERLLRAHDHVATIEGRYDVTDRSLNRRFPEIHPLRFRDWLAQVWSGQ